MNYRIEYDGGRGKKRAIRNPKVKKWAILAVCAAIIVSGTIAWSKGRIFLRDLILPGDEAVTEHALQGLVDDLRDGHSMSDAMEVFCKEIIDGVDS